MIENIHWYGHASFRINGSPIGNSPVVYIDPWRLPAHAEPADVILISHEHHDHCSPADIDRIRQDRTVIIANPGATKLVSGDVTMLRPWQGAINVFGASIRAVSAYTPGHAYHAPSFDGLGFLISIMRHDIYFAGDTDLIPDMEKIGCDIALLPVGGWYTMDFQGAAQAAKQLRPRIAVPMHYGMEVPGSEDFGKRFCALLADSDIEAIELAHEPSVLQI